MANQTKYFKTPFAESGTRAEVPNNSVGGAVGFDTGFGPDYELPQGSAGRKRIERDKYNGLHHSITKNLKQWQENLYPTWIEDDGTGVAYAYPIGMIVHHEGQNWISNEAANQEEPGAGTKWLDVDLVIINDTSIAYEVSTVGSLLSDAILFPAGKIINILDRDASFLFALGGTANGFDILDAGNGNTATLIDKTKAEHFGCKAGGLYDNSAELTFLASAGYQVKFKAGATYKTTSFFDITNNSGFYGNNTTIFCDHSTRIGSIGSGCYFGGFIVDGNNLDHTAIPFRALSPSSNWKIGENEWRNFHGISAFQTYALTIPMYGAVGFQIESQRYINLSQDDDGVVTGKGFVGGLYLVGLDSEVINGKSNGVIGDQYGENIRTVDAGLGVVQDSDLVRVYFETPTTEEFDITVGDCTGRDVHKRIVKVSGCNGVRFGKCESFITPASGATLHAVVETLYTANNITFGDIYSEGPATRCAWLKGKGNKCGDIYDSSGAFGVLFGETGGEAISCQVGDLIGRGNGITSIGTGVSFTNANLCQTGNITGLFAVAAISQPTNTGRNTVNSVTSAGRISVLDGGITIGSILTDIRGELVGGVHYAFGSEFDIINANIVTDGRVTVSVSGQVNGDLGMFKITRVSAVNGVEANHSVFSATGASGGMLRGDIEVEVNNSILGTPSGSSGRSLVYIPSTLRLDINSLVVNVTTPTRGATGFICWLNGVTGQISRLAIKGATGFTAGSSASGNLTITKLEHLVDANFTASSTVNAYLTEKRAANTITGLSNVPALSIDSTRT